MRHWMYFFFFQAEDGIRDIGVTGVQTCALPILPARNRHELLHGTGGCGSVARSKAARAERCGAGKTPPRERIAGGNSASERAVAFTRDFALCRGAPAARRSGGDTYRHGLRVGGGSF